MPENKIFQEILDLIDEIKEVVSNKNWRNYSPVRARILVQNKLGNLKEILSDIPLDMNFKSEAATSFFVKIQDKISEIMNNMDENALLLEWFELELFRLSFASMYASSWGQAGDLQIAGTANALANALIGIKTLNVEELLVDWDHQEFWKRRNLILNYLSSAFPFFFTLSGTLNAVYLHDLEHWLKEGFKAAEQYLDYTEHFWDCKKNIQLERKLRKNTSKPNYSPYYATFAGIDSLLTYLLELQRFFFDDSVKIELKSVYFDIANPDKFFETLMKLIEKAEGYIADLKNHVKKKAFGLNENPLEDETVNETIYQLHLSKVYIKSFYALYRILIKNNLSELSIINQTFFPEILNYLKRYEQFMQDPSFADSQFADGIALMLEELLLFAGVYALKNKNKKWLKEIENKFEYVFTEKGMKRYPTINGLYYTLLTTLDIENDEYENISKYSKNLILISNYALYEPRNAFAYALLGYLLSVLIGQITSNQFEQTMGEKLDEMVLSFPQGLSDEIEIYLVNLFKALEGEKAPYNMTRLFSTAYYDAYSVFIPEVNKLAQKHNFDEEIVYIPFNLESDYIVRVDHSMIEEPSLLVEQEKEMQRKQELVTQKKKEI